MSWIKTISYKKTSGRLRKLYDRVKAPDNNVDNIIMLHSLRPHTLEGHMAIYKYVLHHSSNTLPKWFLETLGVWVSTINICDYCVDKANLVINENHSKSKKIDFQLKKPIEIKKYLDKHVIVQDEA